MVRNLFNDKKTLFVVDSDLDGTGCMVVLKTLLQDICDLTIIQSGIGAVETDLLKYHIDLTDYDIVAFADLVPKLDTFESIPGLKFIFDHHQTTRDIFGERENYFFTLEKCSAKILHDCLTQGFRRRKSLVSFVNIVDAYDRYQQTSSLFPLGKSMNYLLWSSNREENKTANSYYVSSRTPFEKFADLQVRKIKRFDDFLFTEVEQKMINKELEAEAKEYKKIKKNLILRSDDSGNLYALFESPRRISTYANNVLIDFPQVRYVVSRNNFVKDVYRMSLRCRGDYNVKDIAEKWNGGGHASAAGFAFENAELWESFKEGKFHLI